MQTYHVYLAGPIVGLTQAEAQGWRTEFSNYVRDYGVQCLSPLRGKALTTESEVYAPGCARHEDTHADLFVPDVLTQRDLFDLRRSDVMVLHLPYPQRTPIGSLIEFGYAVALQIPIVVWGPQSPVTQHPMVVASYYRRTTDSYDTAVAVLDLLGLGGQQ